MADGPTRIHLTRARAAEGSSYAHRQPTATGSPTSRSVGAAHGSCSTSMPGPHQVQHLPLQTNPSGPPEQDERDTSLTLQPAHAGLRGCRDPRSTLDTAQLSPSQQAFVDGLQGRFGREQAAERQLAGGSGEAGDTAPSPEQRASERSTGGAEQPSGHVPYAESQHTAALQNPGGRTGPGPAPDRAFTSDRGSEWLRSAPAPAL